MDLLEKVVLTADDIKSIEDFFSHYNDPKLNNLVMTPSLSKQIEIFREKAGNNTYTTLDQKKLTQALCGALASTKHPLLKDEALSAVIKACADISEEAQFHEEFENIIR